MGRYAIADLTSPWFWIVVALVVVLIGALLLKLFLFGITR
jgi:hypothetical protein